MANATAPDVFADRIRTLGERTPGGEISPKGAQGQMQVLPETAKSPGFGVTPAQGPGDLDRLGRDYAKALLLKYNGNTTLASAAYNAGPGRVDGWIQQFGDPRTGKISEADWLAKVPYDETRGYAARVGGLGESQGFSPKAQAGGGGNSLLGQGTGGQAAEAPRPSELPDLSAPSAPSAAPDPMRALALLQQLVPLTHSLQPVDYDPWKYVGKA